MEQNQATETQEAKPVQIDSQVNPELAALKQQHAMLCAQLGEKQYHIELIQSDITSLVDKIKEANQKAFSILNTQGMTPPPPDQL